MERTGFRKITAAVISSYAYIRGHNNYGSILQYYALQQYLARLGVEAYWIRFMFPTSQMVKELVRKSLSELRHGFRLKNVCLHVRTQIGFRRFMHDKCHVSVLKYDSLDKLKENPPKADIYITGSDQVWGGWLEPNYLIFAPKEKKRIAYAVSFGKRELTKEHQNNIQNWVRRFDAVSVRESSGVEICRKMGVEAVHLLDPTLLIDDKDYLPADAVRMEKHKYVFCYFINEHNPDNLRITDIESFCSGLGAKLKITGIEGPETIVPSQYICQYAPEEWLNHYKYADYVFTNTFHGTVFSIIFRKKFCVLLQKEFSEKQNERLFSVLNMFGLQDRVLQHGQSIKDVIDNPIDWDYVEKVKAKWRVKTDDFFNKILTE